MAQQELHEEQVKFRDVAACFSEEDWKILQDWQKDFYKNVMNEIHQALIMLGYQIVNPSTLLRIYKGKDVCVQDSQEDTEIADLHDPVLSSHPTVIPDILFRITKDEESYCSNRKGSEENGFSNSPNSGFPVVTATFSLTTEEERKLYPTQHQECRRRESSQCPSSERHVVIPEVVIMNLKEDDEISFPDDLDCQIVESTSNPTALCHSKGINTSSSHSSVVLTKQHRSQMWQFLWKGE
ncbi:zinc finger protein 705F-like isoform X2 [Ambystoma mexicanum]|uniref:zinc finger protein 705F-like isoform X2 n=1 Tax=Ambystoma mexicanum TaxID=8296 RepID=UPI0037E9B8EA